jgi:hypothetical protein
MDELFDGREVAVDPEPVAAAHDLDVLLRHRLLPQPGGFEDIGAIPFEMRFQDAAVMYADSVRDMPVEIKPASCSSAAPTDINHYPIALTADDLDIEPCIVYLSRDPRDLFDHLIASHKRTRLGPTVGHGEAAFGSKEVGEALYVPSLEAAVGLQDDLHVLLRHRPRSISLCREQAALVLPAGQNRDLLPQPGGFEGSCGVLVFFVSDNPPITDRVDDTASVLNPGIAAFELASLPHHRYDRLVPRIYELGKLDLVLIPRIDPLLQYHDYFLGSANHPAFRACPGNVVFDLWISQLDEAFVVAFDKGGERSPHNFDVLLRHRLRSISLRSAAFTRRGSSDHEVRRDSLRVNAAG